MLIFCSNRYLGTKRFSLVNPHKKPPNKHRHCATALLRQNLYLIGDLVSNKMSVFDYNFVQEGDFKEKFSDYNRNKIKREAVS